MKRLLGLAVLFVVLSVSVPSYGYFLIYNLSCTVKGSNNDVKASVPWKGYMVLNLDDSDAIVDVNLIMYGKDSNTPKKQKVYVQLNKYSSTTPQIGTVLYNGPFVIFDFWSDMSEPFNFQVVTVGKGAFKDIGLGSSNKKWVASSVKGCMLVWDGMLLDADDWLTATGAISLSLNTTATKYVNQNSWTQDQIIELGSPAREGLLTMLEDKGYSDATPY